MADLEGLAEALIKGDRNKVVELTKQALNEGVAPQKVLNDGLIAGMNVIGKRFKANEVYVPEVLIAARAMHGGMDVLQPKLVAAGVKPIATVVLGTVKGDLHSIGKNILKLLYETSGFEAHDLGIDVDLFSFINKAKEVDADIIAISALLTTTLVGQRDVIDALKDAGERDRYKVLVGGGATTREWAESIGADGWAATAYEAVTLSTSLVS